MNILQNQLDAGKDKDDLPNNTMENKDLKNPATTTAKNEVSIPVSELKLRSVNIKSNNPDSNVNLDDADTTRMTTPEDGLEIFEDYEDAAKKKKPINYAAKKTAAQGMIDIALLTSNANQLRNLIEYQRETATFYFVGVLIVLSLILQIAVGVFLILKGRFNSKSNAKDAADRVCTSIMTATFLITIINLFIPIFSIPQNTFMPAPAAGQPTNSTG